MDLNIENILCSQTSLVILASLWLLFFVYAKCLPLEAFSLPCIMLLTSIVYFYVVPLGVLIEGETGYFGMYLSDLTWAHFAVFLYSLGAAAAFAIQWPFLTENPGAPRPTERPMVMLTFYVLWGLAWGGAIALFLMGQINLTANENFQMEGGNAFLFLNEAFNMMIPLSIILLIRNNFGWRSLMVLLIVIFVFLQAGFRFRVILTLAGVVTAFAVHRRIRLRISYMLAGATVAVMLSNLLGMVRRYGQGIDYKSLGEASVEHVSSFSGEAGIVYILGYIADNPLPNLVLFEPWTVTFARLIPSFIWPDKPTITYGQYLLDITPESSVGAGVGASQHVEMLFQFGWFGLPFLAFVYFFIISYLIHRLNLLGYEARVAGCSLAPVFFGFYMQSRGYFFQILSDGLFIFGPIFLVHVFDKQVGIANTLPVKLFGRIRLK